MTIMRAHAWPSNAALIADVARLGYIKDEDHVLDPTYGLGNWWTEYRPVQLTTHDIKLDGVDFRDLPHRADTFDVIAFDPPYVAPGGRATSTVPSFNSAFGIDACPRTPALLHEMIVMGLLECDRVLKPRGVLLLKCMNYVTSGKYRTAAYDLLNAALRNDYLLIDEFVHLGSPGPQPAHPRQVHTRANYSNLFILKKTGHK